MNSSRQLKRAEQIACLRLAGHHLRESEKRDAFIMGEGPNENSKKVHILSFFKISPSFNVIAMKIGHMKGQKSLQLGTRYEIELATCQTPYILVQDVFAIVGDTVLKSLAACFMQFEHEISKYCLANSKQWGKPS